MASNVSGDVPVSTSSTAQPKATHRPTGSRSGHAGRSGRQARKIRRLRKRIDALQNPKDPYAKQIDAAVYQRYGEPEAALRQQQAQVPGAFDAYRAIVGGIAAKQAAAYKASLDQLGQFGNTLAAGSQGLLAATQGAQAQGAQVTGATPSSQVDQDAAKAAIVRQGSLGSLGGLLANQGAAAGTYLADQQANSVSQQVGAQAAVDRALTALLKDKGAYRVTTRGDLEAADAAQKLDAAKLQSALQIAGINSATDIAQSKITAKTSRGNNRRTAKANREKDANAVNKWGYTNKEWRSKTEAERQAIIKSQKDSGGKKDGLTPVQRRKARETRHDIMYKITKYRKRTRIVPGDSTTTGGINLPKVVKPTRADVVQMLVDDGYSIDAIRDAYKYWNRRRKRNGGGGGGGASQGTATYSPDHPGGY